MSFTAGLGKVTGGFEATRFLQGAVANPVAGPDGVVYGCYVDFLQHFAIPNVIYLTSLFLGRSISWTWFNAWIF